MGTLGISIPMIPSTVDAALSPSNVTPNLHHLIICADKVKNTIRNGTAWQEIELLFTILKKLFLTASYALSSILTFIESVCVFSSGNIPQKSVCT